MVKKMIPLEPDKYYHIYNRANGNEKIFLNNGNYEFFLQKYKQHIEPVADTFCYCLMPNHFHLLVKIKSSAEIPFLGPSEKIGLYCSKKFSNFFSSYAQAFNKQQGRMGSLFMKNFKRKEVDSEKYKYQLIHYIHHNPQEAGLTKNLEEWPFSSYRKIISNEPTFLNRAELLNWYDGPENFKQVHLKHSQYDLL